MKHQGTGTLIIKLSPTSGVIEDQRTGEHLFVFAEDCQDGVVPTEGTRVSYKRLGIDTAHKVRIQLDESQAA